MKFIVVLVLMLSTTFGAVVTLENIQEFLPADHESVANYVVSNLDTFKEKWNETTDNEEEKFNGSGIDFRRVIRIDGGGEATYIDFDGSNGYILIADGYKLYEFETVGDQPWLQYCDDAYFFPGDGILVKFADVSDYIPASDAFLYHNGYNITTWNDISQMSYEDQVEDEYTSAENRIGAAALPGKYLDGQSWNVYKPTGFSRIYSPNAYVNDFTGDTSWRTSARKYILAYDNWNLGSQYSVYNKFNSKSRISNREGNCVLTAVHNIMEYYGQKVSSKVKYNGMTLVDPLVTDKFYDEAISDGYSPSAKYVPSGYARMRAQAIKAGYYNHEGIPTNKMTALGPSITFGYYVPSSVTRLGTTTLKFIMSFIDKNTPLILTWDDPISIGAKHAMTIMDYCVMGKRSSWWIFSNWEYITMLGGADGLECSIKTGTRWVDWTRITANPLIYRELFYLNVKV